MMKYAAHWVIGIFAFAVWASGKKAGIDESLVSYCAWILPTVVGHALGSGSGVVLRAAPQTAPIVPAVGAAVTQPPAAL